MYLKQVDHIGVATKDINQALEMLKRLGPVTVGAVEDIPTQKVQAVMVLAGEAPIELIQATSPESVVASFIEKRGEGLHHIAYRVDDLAAALSQAEANGFRLIDKQPRRGYAEGKCAFLHPKATLGVLIELVERQPGKDKAPYER